jgi:hypothetical protein
MNDYDRHDYPPIIKPISVSQRNKVESAENKTKTISQSKDSKS